MRTTMGAGAGAGAVALAVARAEQAGPLMAATAASAATF